MNATTITPAEGQGLLSDAKNITKQPYLFSPTAVMNTSSTAHQIITSGKEKQRCVYVGCWVAVKHVFALLLK